jgi:hypothetical protein
MEAILQAEGLTGHERTSRFNEGVMTA